MSRSEVLQASVEIFYENPQNSEVLCDILEKKSGISLRNLEWFITNYSKQKNLSFVTSTGKRFTVHCSYKSTLDGYSKKRSYAYQYRGDEVDYFDDDEEEDDEDDVDVEWYRQELLSLYSQHNPSKVKDVDRLLEKFAG